MENTFLGVSGNALSTGVGGSDRYSGSIESGRSLPRLGKSPTRSIASHRSSDNTQRIHQDVTEKKDYLELQVL